MRKTMLSIALAGALAALSGPAWAADEADVERLRDAVAELPEMEARVTVPGLGSDGGRDVPGRFAIVASGSQPLLLDTASGRVWQIKDGLLSPVTAIPGMWLEGVGDAGPAEMNVLLTEALTTVRALRAERDQLAKTLANLTERIEKLENSDD